MVYRLTTQLNEKIRHFAKFPQTGVSLRQMVLFGQNPSPGTLLRASQFLAEELPIRLAHRVKELDELPHNLNTMPSIVKVKNWYAQSFEDLINFPKANLPQSIKEKFAASALKETKLPESRPNLSVKYFPSSAPQKPVVPLEHRYYSNIDGIDWPPEVYDYNERFTKLIEAIKRRHDPVVTTVV